MMEPISMIVLAGKILSHTSLGAWAKEKLGDVIGDKAAQKIVKTAQIVTGVTQPQLLVEALEKDRELAQQVNHEILHTEKELILAQLTDVQDARQMYQVEHKMADKIADRVMSQNHCLVILLLILNGLAVYFINDSTAMAVVGNLLGGSIAALWQERQQITGFYHGSSLGSKLKGITGK